MIWNDNGLSVYLGDSHFQLSQTAVLALLAGAAILLFLGFLYLRFGGARRGAECRWKRARDHRPPFRKWQCRTCGVEVFTSDRRPPKECKKTLKTGL